MIEYYKEVCKKAFKIWITEAAEPNNTHPIKKMIDDLLTKNIFHTYEDYEQCIYNEVSKRLYKNKNIPISITRMAKLNLPNLIEICSNNNEHIITESIKNLLNSKKDKPSFIKTIRKPILKYYSLYYAAFEQAPNNLKTRPGEH